MKDYIINILKEIVLTFSSKSSLFSSKKIERCLVFTTLLTMTLIYLGVNLKTLDSQEFMTIVAGWLVYGGYNTFVNSKEKKSESENNNQE